MSDRDRESACDSSSGLIRRLEAIRGTLTAHSGHNSDANNRDYGKVDVGRRGFVQLTASDDTAPAQRCGPATTSHHLITS
ncbi:unnamed protein product [Parnassius apollo]|uniref:(apollo) hypothetical protein n=1 Tax=Parnassius apollo TaxID=110799 RepID=A0A8S3VYV4_PARAO|nr:unnamed protein product [Parnassius apollo]